LSQVFIQIGYYFSGAIQNNNACFISEHNAQSDYIMTSHILPKHTIKETGYPITNYHSNLNLNYPYSMH